MFNSMKDMYKAANWTGKGFTSRENLMERLQSNLFLYQIEITISFCLFVRISSTRYYVTTKTT